MLESHSDMYCTTERMWYPCNTLPSVGGLGDVINFFSSLALVFRLSIIAYVQNTATSPGISALGLSCDVTSLQMRIVYQL